MRKVDSPRGEVGEIDTRVPFQSVKAAVSLFGEVAVPKDRFAVKRRSSEVYTSSIIIYTILDFFYTYCFIGNDFVIFNIMIYITLNIHQNILILDILNVGKKDIKVKKI
jgi:hypothetical protein